MSGFPGSRGKEGLYHPGHQKVTWPIKKTVVETPPSGHDRLDLQRGKIRSASRILMTGGPG